MKHPIRTLELSITPTRAHFLAGVYVGIVVSALVVGLSGCAGRSPAPIQIAQAGDRAATCPAIYAEMQANNARAAELSGEQGAKVAQNVAAGTIGLFFFPAWFLMDFQGAAGVELNALQGRQQYLGALADERHCA